MKAVLQRVTSASVEVDGRVVGRIAAGLLVSGVAKGDGEADGRYLVEKPGLSGSFRMSREDESGAGGCGRLGPACVAIHVAGPHDERAPPQFRRGRVSR